MFQTDKVQLKSDLADHKSDIIKTFNRFDHSVDPSKDIAYMKTASKENQTHHVWVVHHPPDNKNRIMSDKAHKELLTKVNDHAEKKTSIVQMRGRDISNDVDSKIKKETGKGFNGRISLILTPKSPTGRNVKTHINMI